MKLLNRNLNQACNIFSKLCDTKYYYQLNYPLFSISRVNFKTVLYRNGRVTRVEMEKTTKVKKYCKINSGTSMLRYIHLILCIILSVIGICDIVFGVIILMSIRSMQVNAQGDLHPQSAMPTILITHGLAYVFISILGIFVAIRESICLIMTYAVSLLILLILLFVGGPFTNEKNVNTAMEDVVDQVWALRKPEKENVFDAVQGLFKCCGSNGFRDYNESIIARLPSSCCNGPCLTGSNIRGGCRTKFVEWISFSTNGVKAFSLGLLVVDMLILMNTSVQGHWSQKKLKNSCRS